jgi:hypothetical protein
MRLPEMRRQGHTVIPERTGYRRRPFRRPGRLRGNRSACAPHARGFVCASSRLWLLHAPVADPEHIVVDRPRLLFERAAASERAVSALPSRREGPDTGRCLRFGDWPTLESNVLTIAGGPSW